MPFVLSTMFNISLIALVLSVVYLEVKRWRGRRLAPSIIIVLIAFGVFFLINSETVESKGSTDETITLVFCYIAMLFGMLVEFFYTQVERQRRFQFNMELLLPIFASPIVFIPVLTITSDMVGGAFTKSKMMVYLIAFQNGFFWKSFFEERRQRLIDGVAEAVRRVPGQAVE